jgi:hypothetical protein
MILEDYGMQKVHIPSLQELINYQNVENYPFEKTFEEERNNPIFVLHTSGSTGNEPPPFLNPFVVFANTIGIPKPMIYKNEFVTRIINLNLLPPPEGFRV